jgi:hypothetical protein
MPVVVTNSSTPSKSYERLIDGKTTPDFEYFNQVLPPELARQIMMGKSLQTTVKLRYNELGYNELPVITNKFFIFFSPKST